jgi:hypothetical protein
MPSPLQVSARKEEASELEHEAAAQTAPAA